MSAARPADREGYDKESKALSTVQAQWSAPYCYLRPSILENPYGEGGGMWYAIHWLKSSPLDWGPVNAHEEYYPALIENLGATTEEALAHFEQFRTIFSRPSLAEQQFLNTTVDIPDWRASQGRIPTRIHKSVKRAFWALHSTSRFSMEDPPSLYMLSLTGFLSSEFQDKQGAAVAALVCVMKALNCLITILELWEREFQNRARRHKTPHFVGNYGDPEWDDVLYDIRMRLDILSFETEKRRDAVSWGERAQAWLSHADEILAERGRTARKLEHAVSEAEQSAMAAVESRERAKRSSAARMNQSDKKTREQQNLERVRAAYGRLFPEQQGRGAAGIISRGTGLSRPTIRKFLKQLLPGKKEK